MKKILIAIVILMNGYSATADTISPSDFTFVGGFKAPSTLQFGVGLTLRKSGGTTYLYSIIGGNTVGVKGNVVEYIVPETLDTSYPFTQLTTSVNYGDIYQDKIVDVVSNGSGGSPPYVGLSGGATRPSGLFWDETDQRMYWAKVVNYNTTSTPSDASIGYSTMDFVNHTGTGVGSWKLDVPRSEGGNGGRYSFSFSHIPSSFASTYLGGKRLAVGFGGGTSISSNGLPSLGPAAFAINPPSLSNEGHLDYLSSAPTEILSHFPDEEYATRNALYPGLSFRAGAHTGDTEYWFPEDPCGYGVWISYGGKSGLMVWALQGAGVADTTIATVTSKTVFTVVDPGDIQAGDVIRIGTDYVPNAVYPFEQVRVASVEGNEITLQAATTGNINVGGICHAGDWYAGGGPSVTRFWTPMYIYSEENLAATVQDQVANPPYTMPVASNVNWALEGATYPRPGTTTGESSPIYSPKGVAFDNETGRLYLMARDEGTGEVPSIWVYQLNASIAGIKSGRVRIGGSLSKLSAE